MTHTHLRLRGLAAWCLTLALCLPVSALAPGDAMGWVLYSDVAVEINNHPIPAYNIDGNMYVVAEDLAGYGFTVSWDASGDGILSVAPGTGVITAPKSPIKNTHTAGTKAMPYLYTRVLTYIAGEPVFARNIGGLTCIAMDDLAYFLADSYTWDATGTGILRLTTPPDGTSHIPGDWKTVYKTPSYAKDTPVSGKGAMWEFQKDSAGNLALTATSGATEFTPCITLEDDRVSYQVHFTEKKLSLAGSEVFTSALHTTDAHQIVAKHALEMDMWKQPQSFRYRAYRMQNTAKADALQENCAEALAVWRVYINEEPVDGIIVTEPYYYYQAPGGREQTYEEYTYLFGKRYPMDQVNKIRVELSLPE